MKLLFTTLALCFAFVGPLTAQEVDWMTWEEAVAAHAEAPRKIFVDVYTDWCGWCKRMDASTFSDPAVVEELNANFYAVKLNAEQRGDIVFRDETYTFEKGGRGGVHGLAKMLLQGRLGYPTVVFLDEDIDVIQPVPGYQEPDTFAKIVRYFGIDEYRRTPWNEYEGR